MVFSSLVFLFAYLAVTLVIYYAVPRKARNIFLFFINLLFYGWGEPMLVFLMVFNIFFNYLGGYLVDKFRSDRKKKKLFLILTCALDIGILAVFKYTGLIVDTVNLLPFLNIPTVQISLPIGISFYTFQTMSYVIDVYRNDAPVSRSFINFGTYVALFPQLIAGPIVRYRDVAYQLEHRRETLDRFTKGVKLFCVGLGKKVLIANQMGAMWEAMQATGEANGVVGSWFGIIGYAMQIYFDFSGYSDMAIGLGKMFGFKFMKNFDDPYMATSISDFWKRWHISLTSWFREYLYIPLGGNRKGCIRTYINIFIVFLVTGIWHGAAWTFIVWGVFNGIIMIIERIGLKKWLDACPIRILCRIYTCFIVLLSWVMFRADTIAKAFQYYLIMFIPRANGLRIYDLSEILNRQNVSMLALGFIFAFIVPYIKNVSLKPQIKTFYKTIVEPFILCLVYIACIMLLVANTYNPFIYFRF